LTKRGFGGDLETLEILRPETVTATGNRASRVNPLHPATRFLKEDPRKRCGRRDEARCGHTEA
jgi:hypothetical protein